MTTKRSITRQSRITRRARDLFLGKSRSFLNIDFEWRLKDRLGAGVCTSATLLAFQKLDILRIEVDPTGRGKGREQAYTDLWYPPSWEIQDIRSTYFELHTAEAIGNRTRNPNGVWSGARHGRQAAFEYRFNFNLVIPDQVLQLCSKTVVLSGTRLDLIYDFAKNDVFDVVQGVERSYGCRRA